jgi:hypothetical protein
MQNGTEISIKDLKELALANDKNANATRVYQAALKPAEKEIPPPPLSDEDLERILGTQS